MVIKTKCPLFFHFFFALCLSSALLSSGFLIPKLGTDLERCIDECREYEEELSGLFACAARCERKYSEWEPETSPRELEQCRQRCLAEESERTELHQCQRRCEEQVIREREEERVRQRERDREREREYQRGLQEREEGEQQQGRKRDPADEYKECQQVCKRQEARQRPQCLRRCKRQYEEQQIRKQEEREHQGGSRDDETPHHHNPQRRYEECLKQCERQERGEQQQQQCKSWCEKQREKEERRREKEGNSLSKINWAEEQQQRNNPYYFQAERFQYRLRSQEGHMRVLQRFSAKSHLLRGIDNYRLAIVEASPGTLVVPHHADAEIILVVVKGRGTITLVSQERRESFSMEHGDVIRIPAGNTFYLINQDNVDRLQVAKLIRPVNTPGQFREYFAAGGGNRKSYYKVFSSEILERSLNTPREQLDRLFKGQQRQQGTIRRATQEQLKALSQHVSSPKRRGKEPRGPFNVLSRKPLYYSNFGRFFEANPNDFKQLQEIDSSVTFVEINQGAMMVPHYNSRTTTIVLVVEGKGRFEMGCPHISRQSQESQERRERSEEEEEEEGERSGQLRQISANLSPGDVFIIPAGHPIALIASQNEKLQTVGFGINALNNQRNFLAGKINIMNQVEREALEIAVNVPARLLERIFNNNPKESYFVAGPDLAGPEAEQQRDQEGRNYSLPSILDLPRFF